MLTNYHHSSNGRIWITWDANIYKVTAITTTSQLIHCIVSNIPGTFSCECTIVYGFNSIDLRKPLCSDLRNIGQNVNLPWIICGDFNAVLHPTDRIFGFTITLAEIKDYSECIHDLMLNELSWKGEYYTWTNKQLGAARICSKIDTAFGNHE